MKTLILSDIYAGTENSIIPFSLRWARNTGTKAEILHIIDQREAHGVYSPYSDSQTITPGETELHSDRLRKERIMTNNTLKEFVSREFSSLNYPLRLTVTITIGNFEEMLRKHLSPEDTLIVNCSNSISNSYFDSYEDMLNVIKSLPCQVLCINENKRFKTPEKTLYILRNGQEENTDKRQHINDLLMNLQSYPKIKSTYYGYSSEVEERPVNHKEYEILYTIAPGNNEKTTNNIDSLIQSLNIDLLAMQVNNEKKINKNDLIFNLLTNKTTPILFIPETV